MDVMSIRRGIIEAQDGFVPPEYQVYDYVQCDDIKMRIVDGTINTDDSTLKFDFDLAMLTHTNYGMPWGNYKNENTRCWRICQLASSGAENRVYMGLGNRRAGSSTSLYLPSAESYINRRINYKIEWGKATWSYDDFTYSATTESDDYEASDSEFALIRGSCQCRLWYCKIESQGKLAHSYIPVKRKTDNKTGLYDTVTCRFLTSSGSIGVIVGND